MLKWMLIFIVVGAIVVGVDEAKSTSYLAHKYDEEKKNR